MNGAPTVVITLLAALGSALMAGFFFAFSVCVMGALGRLAPDLGIAAMQSINVVVRNPWFFAAFFGTAALCVVLAVLSLINWTSTGALYLLIGSLLYLLGVIAVTFVFNLPLNNALAGVAAGDAAAGELWTRYLSVWTAWNHVRTVAPLLASAAFIMALRS
jgi:uncharacterized membrane protein